MNASGLSNSDVDRSICKNAHLVVVTRLAAARSFLFGCLYLPNAFVITASSTIHHSQSHEPKSKL
jgi:hypothetical protein